MTEVIYNSRDEYFKTPLGAVTADTELTYRIKVASDPDPVAVRMIVRYDRHDTPAVYEMNRVAADGTDAAAAADSAADSGTDSDGFNTYAVSLTIHDTGLYWYHFEIETADGPDPDDRGGLLLVGRDGSNRAGIATSPDFLATWQQTVYHRKYYTPDWIYGGIYYHVFVDRFCKSDRPHLSNSGTGRPGSGRTYHENWDDMPDWEPVNGKIYNNDFFGGDLNGVRQKLPYLASLNVKCIYLSPIFEAYSSHKYDTGDYEKIDPSFGSEEDFSALCKEAAELGIRVICDGVFAHTGSDSRYFDKYEHYAKRAAYAGDKIVPGAYGHPESPYRSWYFFHDEDSYDCWWDFRTLPKVNKRDPSYIEYITGENGIVRKWIRVGASGWRLDVADELPNDFLDSLVHAAKAERPDSIIIGEVWEDASNKTAYDERKNYFEGNRLDSVMNYPFRTAIIEFVRRGNAEGLAQTVESIAENYPPDVLHCLMNVLGTHDSVRIITALAGEELDPDTPRFVQSGTHLTEEEWARGIELLKTASLLQMTLPGVPCIYYGDEAGVEGYKDPFNRTCYPWGRENTELLDWYRNITAIRASRAVYRKGAYRTIAATDGLYAFERTPLDAALAGTDVSATDAATDAARPIVTAANCGTAAQTLELAGTWRDLLTDAAYENAITLHPGDRMLLEKI